MTARLEEINAAIRHYEAELARLLSEKTETERKLAELKTSENPIRTIIVNLTPRRKNKWMVDDSNHFEKLVGFDISRCNMRLDINVQTNTICFGKGEDRTFITNDPLYDLDLNHIWIVADYELYPNFDQEIRKITLQLSGVESCRLHFECIPTPPIVNKLKPLPPVVSHSK